MAPSLNGQLMKRDQLKIDEPHATALMWIVRVLQDRKIPFQITGGLAARFYGANRPLADIDLDVPERSLERLGRDLAPHLVFGPAPFRDPHWELDLMTVAYNGVPIDLGGAERAKLFSVMQQAWLPAPADLGSAVVFEVLGGRVPVVDRDALVAYKTTLGRDVDLLDIAALRR